MVRAMYGVDGSAKAWLVEGSIKAADKSPDPKADYSSQAFYPLTLPLTTGPGTIAVMISLGLSKDAYSDYSHDFRGIS